MVNCPICNKDIDLNFINKHLDTCTKNPNQKKIKINEEGKQNGSPTSSNSKSTLSSLLSGNKKRQTKSQTKMHSTYKYQPSSQKRKINEASFEGHQSKEEIFDTLTTSYNNNGSSISSSNSNATDNSIEILDGSEDETFTSPERKPKVPKLEETQSPQQYNSGMTSVGKARIQEQVKLLKIKSKLPLAERLRPTNLDNYVGQDHLVGKGGILRGFIENDRIPSLILWGYPGTGKTTLARIISHSTHSRFVELSATLNGINDCKKVFEEAKNEIKLTKRKTIIFVDEIHRFNKAQQDIFLPHVERGSITLIGATTENPSFQLNSALLSRCRVFVLKKLDIKELTIIIRNALVEINKTRRLVFNKPVLKFLQDAIDYLCDISDGDSRSALNLLELTDSHFMNNEASEKMIEVSAEELRSIFKRTHMVYDRVGDAHYDTISAFHKSIRGGDPDAAMYYLARMLKGGESPLYIARRMIRIASEDVGVLDDSCLPFAVAAYQAVQFVGLPEADLALVHCAVKLAKAPKSVEIYRGWKEMNERLNNEPNFASAPIPLHIRNAPTKLMDDLGYGEGYKYNPDYIDGKVKQEYFPSGFKGMKVLHGKHLGTKIDPDL